MSSSLTLPKFGMLTSGFGRWVLLHKGDPRGYATKSRTGDVLLRSGLPLEDVVPALAEMGYDAVTVCAWIGHTAYPYSLSKRARASLPGWIRSFGLEIGAVNAAGGSRHTFDRYGYTTADADERAERVEFTKNCIDLAAEWGASHVEDLVGMAHPDVQEEDAWNRMRDVIGELAEYAASQGVRYAIEPYMGIVNTTERFERLHREIGRADLACVVDPVNLIVEESTPLSEIAQRLAPFAIATHIKGYSPAGRMTQPGGENDTFDIITFWRALTEGGYTGTLTFEDYPDSYERQRNPFSTASSAIEDTRARFVAASA